MIIITILETIAKMTLFGIHEILTSLINGAQTDAAPIAIKGIIHRPGRRPTAAVLSFKGNGGYAN